MSNALYEERGLKATQHSSSRLSWTMLGLSVLTLFLFAAAFEFLPLDPLVARLKTLLDNLGPLGPVLFIGLFVLAVVAPPVPERPLILVSGVIFPLWLAVILTILGATIGASVNFYLARRYGTRLLQRSAQLDSFVSSTSPLITWRSVILVRMFVGFTFDWFSYYAGLTPIRTQTFVAATAIGIAPGTVAEIYAGSFLTSNPIVTVGIGLTIVAVALVGSRFPVVRQMLSSQPARDDASAAKDRGD